MLELNVPSMTCGGCAGAIRRALAAADPQAVVEADPPSRRLRVQANLDSEAVLAVLERIGHPAQVAEAAG